MHNNITMRIIPAFGQYTNRYHRLNLTFCMASASAYALDRCCSSNKADRNSQLFYRLDRGFRNCYIRAKPCRDRGRLYLLSFFKIDGTGWLIMEDLIIAGASLATGKSPELISIVFSSRSWIKWAIAWSDQNTFIKQLIHICASIIASKALLVTRSAVRRSGEAVSPSRWASSRPFSLKHSKCAYSLCHLGHAMRFINNDELACSTAHPEYLWLW